MDIPKSTKTKFDCKKLLGGFCEKPSVRCNKEWIRKMLGEFLGTFFFLYFGCMAVFSHEDKARHLFEIVFDFVAAVSLSLHCFAVVSGCHINPAISLGACVMGLLTWDGMLVYWIFQMLGGAAGFAALALSVPRHAIDVSPGKCTAKLTVHIAQGAIIEFVLTFLLVLYCCAIWSKPNNVLHDSLVIRFLFLLVALVYAGVHQTGANLNPARHFAPAIWYMQFDYVYMYMTVPLLGGFVAAICWKLFWNTEKKDPDEEV